MKNYVNSVRTALSVRGGGIKGTIALARRALIVYRSMGTTGFIRWIRGGVSRGQNISGELSKSRSIAPTPVEALRCQVGIVAHIFYPDLVDELAAYLANLPVPFTLLVSTPDAATRILAETRFEGLKNLIKLKINVVANRGRDIAPLLVTFREEVLELDIICHVHTKKSSYTGIEQKEWRRYLMGSLLGSGERIGWILGMLDADPKLGIIYPETYVNIPLSAHKWLANETIARDLAKVLDFDFNTEKFIDFPAGSMFWAKVTSLRPLYNLKLRVKNFPREAGQKDGTLQHALERIFAELVKGQDQKIGVLPSDGSCLLNPEGGKNWTHYFSASLNDKIMLRSSKIRLASFDIFDTLVLRAFLSSDGALKYFSHIVLERFQVDNFYDIRDAARNTAQVKKQADPDINEIYAEIENLEFLPGVLESIKTLEIRMEKLQLNPRSAAIGAMETLSEEGIHIVGISDMYLDSDTIRSLLPPAANDRLKNIFVSCETRKRKDDDGMWKFVENRVGVKLQDWLHVGDNELSDVHQPLAYGLSSPVYVLSPRALLHATPYLRSLARTKPTSWQNDLWLGLVANRFLALADAEPHCFGATLTLPTPDILGYCIIGPLLLDYTAWLARYIVANPQDAVAFVSRDGYLLNLSYETMRQFLQPNRIAQGTYLLSSRRGATLAGARSAADVFRLLETPFDGTFYGLLAARMGEKIAGIVMNNLGTTKGRSIIQLPAMRSDVQLLLQPSMAAILEVAAEERKAYLNYWHDKLGDAKPLICDIGYSGTIQAALSRMTGLTLDGAYFALTRQAAAVNGTLMARFYDERYDGDRSRSVVLHNDILLESMFKAPHGQLLHFQQVSGALESRPIFEVEKQTTRQHLLLDSVHQGACAFVRDVGNVIGNDILKMDLDRRLVQEPLSCLGTGVWRTGTWGKALFTDDFYSGRGIVHPTH